MLKISIYHELNFNLVKYLCTNVGKFNAEERGHLASKTITKTSLKSATDEIIHNYDISTQNRKPEI